MSRRTVENRGSPGRTLLYVVALALALGGVYWAGHYTGKLQASAHQGAMAKPAEGALAEIELLRNALEVERKQHELDERALELVRSELAVGSQDRASLQEQLRFYRALMAPGSVKQGVSIRPPQLVADEDTGAIAFSVMVQQKANKHQRVIGTLSVQIKGTLAGQEVFYPVSELSDHLTGVDAELQFRYFQALEGELTLPGNFEPISLEVTAQIAKPKKLVLNESFPWKLQERFTHFGK